MPSVSNTARIGPPAMIPVPGGAARRKTRPAPWRPATSWWSVRPSRNGTRMRLRLAVSVALRIASGTSRALPWPKPTRPFSSPTITSAAKPKRRPPFTTFATRLMWTSLSTNSLSSRSRSRSRPRGSRAMVFRRTEDRRRTTDQLVARNPSSFILYPSSVLCPLSSVLCRPFSEFQPALARGIRESLDAAVIEIAAAVEHHVLDALCRRPLGDELADRLRGRDIGAGLEARAHVLFERGSARERLAFEVVDHLRIDV